LAITLFVGSSSAAKSQAKVFVNTFSSATLKFIPWWDTFTAGRTLLEELDNVHEKVDGAVLLFSPEAQAEIRGQPKQIPNLNVLFEFGYFYGVLGKDRVAMLKYGDFYLPSDLGGYIHIFGSNGFRRGASNKIGKRTTGEFERWAETL
jgi:predicted nucleotide-binding protein